MRREGWWCSSAELVRSEHRRQPVCPSSEAAGRQARRQRQAAARPDASHAGQQARAPYRLRMAQAMLEKPHMGACGTPCAPGAGQAARAGRGGHVGQGREGGSKLARPRRDWASRAAAAPPAAPPARLHVDEHLVAGDVLLYRGIHAARAARRLDLRLEVVVRVGVGAETARRRPAACRARGAGGSSGLLVDHTQCSTPCARLRAAMALLPPAAAAASEGTHPPARSSASPPARCAAGRNCLAEVRRRCMACERLWVARARRGVWQAGDDLRLASGYQGDLQCDEGCTRRLA